MSSLMLHVLTPAAAIPFTMPLAVPGDLEDAIEDLRPEAAAAAPATQGVLVCWSTQQNQNKEP